MSYIFEVDYMINVQWHINELEVYTTSLIYERDVIY
jgi:hypothetical protein